MFPQLFFPKPVASELGRGIDDQCPDLTRCSNAFAPSPRLMAMLTLLLLAALTAPNTLPHHYGTCDPVSGVVANRPTSVVISVKDEICCDLWWVANDAPLRSKGWDLQKVYHVRAREYPSFRIYYNGKWQTHEGPLYKSKLRQITGVPLL